MICAGLKYKKLLLVFKLKINPASILHMDWEEKICATKRYKN
jgi:hypothetical protein